MTTDGRAIDAQAATDLPLHLYTQRLSLGRGTMAERFGFCDTKGREIGAEIVVEHVEYKLPSPEAPPMIRWGVAAGFYFEFTPQATRDGKSYGAAQTTRRFKTSAEREKAIDRYLVDARKRAAKLASKAGA